MNEITIREMRSDEVPLLVEWLYKHKETTHLDLEPFRKNQVQIYVAEDETGILCFIPIMYVYKFDAIGPRPNLASFRLARAFKKMTEFLKFKAAKDNIGVVFLQPSDEKFSEFLRADALGYKKLNQDTLFMDFNQKSEAVKCAE